MPRKKVIIVKKHHGGGSGYPNTNKNEEGDCIKYGCAIFLLPLIATPFLGMMEDIIFDSSTVIGILFFAGIPIWLLYTIFKEDN